MTTLANRPNTALLIVDVQTGVVAKAHDRDAVVARIAALADKARADGVPVIWVRHENEQLVPGQDAWQIAPELHPRSDEPIVEKRYGDSFEDTTLEPLLAKLGVGKLLVAGAMTDQCIRSTLHGAITRGYDATLVADAHTTEDFSEYGAPTPDKVIAHTNLYWQYHQAPGRRGGIVTAAEATFA